MKNATRNEIESGEAMLASEIDALTAEHAATEAKIAASDVIDELEEQFCL